MRIAILCNDRIALPALDFLVSSGLTVAVGMPDRAGETQTLVKNRCVLTSIPFQLISKKTLKDDLLNWMDSNKPDVVFVKTFPWLIPAEVLTIPQYGFINFHYAPLPAWRGSNPLFWMLRNRENMGGVSVHEMSETYDTGPILLEQTVPIHNTVNFGIFYTQLAFAGLQLTQELIRRLQTNQLIKKEQDASMAKWYGHPKAADLLIDWQNMEAEDIIALVKACNPWNKGAGTKWKGWTFGITYASVGDELQETLAPGTILSLDPVAGFTIACRNKKTVVAEVVYCEEGFYPGYCLSAFGLQKHHQLS